jgi:hypothetical protein
MVDAHEYVMVDVHDCNEPVGVAVGASVQAAMIHEQIQEHSVRQEIDARTKVTPELEQRNEDEDQPVDGFDDWFLEHNPAQSNAGVTAPRKPENVLLQALLPTPLGAPRRPINASNMHTSASQKTAGLNHKLNHMVTESFNEPHSQNSLRSVIARAARSHVDELAVQNSPLPVEQVPPQAGTARNILINLSHPDSPSIRAQSPPFERGRCIRRDSILQRECDMMDLSWDDLALVRKAAEIYTACCSLDIAFKLHRLVWQRLELSETCPWGDLKQVRTEQLVFCARSASCSRDLKTARLMIETYVLNSMTTMDEDCHPIIHLSLSAVLSKLGDEDAAASQWKRIIKQAPSVTPSSPASSNAESIDLRTHSNLLHAKSLQRVSQSFLPARENTSLAENSMSQGSRYRTKYATKSSGTPNGFIILMYHALSWCRERLLDAAEGPSGLLHPDFDSMACRSIECKNTTQLFSFFWTQEDLTMSSVSEPGWVSELRKQVVMSLADILWTISRLVISKCRIPAVYVNGWTLRQAAIDTLYSLGFAPEDKLFEIIQDASYQSNCMIPDCDQTSCGIVRLIEARLGVFIARDVQPNHASADRGPSQDISLDEIPLKRTLASSMCSSSLSSMRRCSQRIKQSTDVLEYGSNMVSPSTMVLPEPCVSLGLDIWSSTTVFDQYFRVNE